MRARSHPEAPPSQAASAESEASSMKTTSARTEWHGVVVGVEVAVVVAVVVSQSSSAAIKDATKLARLPAERSPRCLCNGSDASKFSVPKSGSELTSKAHLVTDVSRHAGWFSSAWSRASADTGLPASVGLPLPSVSTTTWAGYSGRRAQSISVVKVPFPAHSVRTASNATSKLVSE